VIVTVTLNAALDVTYLVPRVELHGSHRVTSVSQVGGGKGVNVASVLAQQGRPVIATGLLGGVTGGLVRADLDARGLVHRFSPVAGETRRAVTVVSEADGDATVFNEPGPTVTGAEWHGFLTDLRSLLAEVRPEVVVASGSLPPGIPTDAYAAVTRLAHEAGALAVVDTSAAALLAALPAAPDLVKPNRAELAEVTGEADPVSGAIRLLEQGAREVVVSAGAEGLVDVTAADEVWRAALDAPLSGNPTGAGDAAVAALAAGLADGRTAREALVDAVAWSAAAVLHPLAGHVRADDVSRLRARVQVTRSGPADPAASSVQEDRRADPAP
jgi:1-phosphofructokinase family hexose kinase